MKQKKNRSKKKKLLRLASGEQKDVLRCSEMIEEDDEE